MAEIPAPKTGTVGFLQSNELGRFSSYHGGNIRKVAPNRGAAKKQLVHSPLAAMGRVQCHYAQCRRNADSICAGFRQHSGYEILSEIRAEESGCNWAKPSGQDRWNRYSPGNSACLARTTKTSSTYYTSPIAPDTNQISGKNPRLYAPATYNKQGPPALCRRPCTLMATRGGFEPPLEGPKPPVLPLHYRVLFGSHFVKYISLVFWRQQNTTIRS